MQVVTSAVIAAAGLGSRIGLGMPKCMIEIEGTTILTRLIASLRMHVSVIHLVIGYREEMVIKYCATYHRDVVLVRNPHFLTTNTAHSLSMGAQHLSGKTLYLDGDLLIAPESLGKFLSAARKREILVGVTDAKSENAVFVHGGKNGDSVSISGFSRNNKSKLEWANVLVAPNNLLRGAQGYVFERLTEHLPLDGHMLTLAEVDTFDDLSAARYFATQLDNSFVTS
jgi:choline kinase